MSAITTEELPLYDYYGKVKVYLNGQWRVLAARAMPLSKGEFMIMRHNVTEGKPEKKTKLIQRARDKIQDG